MTTNQVTQLATKLKDSYDPEMFLGRLCWYSIPDSVNITRGDFVTLLADKGMPFASGIPDIRPVDVFKRAATAAERNKYVPTLSEANTIGAPTSGCYINYMFRNSGQDKDNVYRTLIREVVDASGHKLAYEEVCTVTYDRKAISPTPPITHSVNHFVLDVEQDVVFDVYSYFKTERDRITPYSIRECVRKGLEWNFSAIKVRPSGGLYFIQEQFAEQLEALEEAINSIGGYFHTMPLLDDGKQREMLRKAFEDESLDDINVLMSEMSEIMVNDKLITSDRYVDMKTRYDHLIKKVVNYSDILDEAMETTCNYLEIAEKQMIALRANIKSES